MILADIKNIVEHELTPYINIPDMYGHVSTSDYMNEIYNDQVGNLFSDFLFHIEYDKNQIYIYELEVFDVMSHVMLYRNHDICIISENLFHMNNEMYYSNEEEKFQFSTTSDGYIVEFIDKLLKIVL